MKILFVMSGVDYITDKNGKQHKTGYWAEEFVTPYRELREAGVDITVATPRGVIPAVDTVSFQLANWNSPEEMRQAEELIMSAWKARRPIPLESLKDADLDKFDAVFYPGGHSPMEDLPKNADSGRILRYFHAKAKTTALICHAPIALLSAKEGQHWPYAGYKMTVFSNSEESQSHLASHLTYSVEDELKKNGGDCRIGKDWQPTLVEDRELITGQNPMSATLMAQAILRRLGAPTRAKTATQPQ